MSVLPQPETPESCKRCIERNKKNDDENPIVLGVASVVSRKDRPPKNIEKDFELEKICCIKECG